MGFQSNFWTREDLLTPTNALQPAGSKISDSVELLLWIIVGMLALQLSGFHNSFRVQDSLGRSRPGAYIEDKKSH